MLLFCKLQAGLYLPQCPPSFKLLQFPSLLLPAFDAFGLGFGLGIFLVILYVVYASKVFFIYFSIVNGPQRKTFLSSALSKVDEKSELNMKIKKLKHEKSGSKHFKKCLKSLICFFSKKKTNIRLTLVTINVKNENIYFICK